MNYAMNDVFNPIRFTCAFLNKLLALPSCVRSHDLCNLWISRLFHVEKADLQKLQTHGKFSLML